jgi:hypothetical protein
MPTPATKLSRAIPVAHHALVMRMRGEANPDTGAQWTYDEIADHLATLGVTCSRMAVIRLEARISKRGDALIVEALRGAMLDAVGPMRTRVVKASKHVATLIDGEEDAAKAATAMRALTGALDTLAKLAGVAAPIAVDLNVDGTVTLSDARTQLAAALARAAPVALADGAGGGDPKPLPGDG